MTTLLSHPTGNANVRAALRGLGREGLLDGYWTALAAPPALAAAAILPEGLRRQIGRRSFGEVPWSRTHVRPLREIARLGAGALGLRGLTRHETGWASVDAVYHALDRAVARHLRGPGGRAVRAVYAYDDGALESFRAARARGAACVYDLPIAHWRTLRRLLAEEAELHPDWAGTMDGLRDSPAKRARKDAEIAGASRIVVASSFTRRSLEGQAPATTPIDVVPYGAPPVRVAQPASRAAGAPIALFYAGHLAQRKGLAYLIAALERLEVPWRLTLAGPRTGTPPAVLDRFLSDPRCRWLGVVPHPTLLEAMTQAHAFVFPSIVEGFGLVLWEAMAAGLPIIATPHTAAPDIVTDGVEGFFVPIRDPDAIAGRITRLYEDEALRRQMAAAALAAAARAGWEDYEARIAAIVAEASA